MTLDTTIPTTPSYIQQYGNTVSVFPADQINRIEVWRAPQLTGAPNDAAAVQATVLPPSPLGGVTFIDPLPPGTGPFYYKSRHIDAAGNPSLFTTYTDALTPVLIVGAAAMNPMAAFGAIVDQLPPSTRYEMRFASNYVDPDLQDGMQSYIDFPATTNFMRVGQTPLAVASSTSANPAVVTVTAHGYVTGDVVTIRGHLVNTSINGTWPITVLTNDTFSVPVAGVGTGVATGHVVRLSLTIDSFGNLVVYAIVRAVQLVVTGIATFNGVLRALAGTLVRSLQHSVTGEYGDTNINRIMLDANNVQVMGDAGTGTTNEAVRLGSHSIGTTTTRTTAAFDNPAAGSRGWNDPDGTDNGKNTLLFSGNGNSTVAVGSRLFQKLGVVTDGDFVDAYDDNYKVSFRVTADYLTGGNPNATVVSTVTAEVSTNSGASWAALPGSWSVTAGGTGSGFSASAAATFSPTFAVSGAPAHVWFRFALNVASTILDSTYHTGTSQGEVLCFSGAYLGSNYATTWLTAGSAFVRRNLKLFATANGSSETMPHAYLEPIVTTPVAANTQKGEVWLEDVTLGVALAYKDATKVVLLRNLVRLLNVAYNKTTTSTGANAVVYSYVLAANQLLEAGQMLRIRIGGLVGASSVNPISVNFGGTVVYSQNHANGTDFWIEIVIHKTGANTQAYSTVSTSAATVKATTSGTMTVTDTASITIDFRCSQAGAGTFTFRTISIELAYAPESVG